MIFDLRHGYSAEHHFEKWGRFDEWDMNVLFARGGSKAAQSWLRMLDAESDAAFMADTAARIWLNLMRKSGEIDG